MSRCLKLFLSNKKIAVSIAIYAGALICSVHSQILNFDFTITSQYYYEYANYCSYTAPETHTLTGEIIGLQNNATTAPADVLIFCTIFPDHGGLSGFDQNPYSLVAHGFNEVGEFTVSNGTILGTSSGGVSFNYHYNGSTSAIWDNFYFNGVSVADGTDDASGIVNVNGQNGGSSVFSGATYTLVVPEPAS